MSTFHHFGLNLPESLYTSHMNKSNYAESFEDYVRRITLTDYSKKMSESNPQNSAMDIEFIKHGLINGVIDQYATSTVLQKKIDNWSKLKINCNKFYDLSISNFNIRASEDFKNEVIHFTSSHHFSEIKDLSLTTGEQSGLYLMVLDNYKSMYLGATTDSFKHQICEHWRKQESVTSLTAGTVLPINAFSTLDTTRLYACKINSKKELVQKEHLLMSQIPLKYSLNRITDTIDELDGQQFENCVHSVNKIYNTPLNNDQELLPSETHLKREMSTSVAPVDNIDTTVVKTNTPMNNPKIKHKIKLDHTKHIDQSTSASQIGNTHPKYKKYYIRSTTSMSQIEPPTIDQINTVKYKITVVTLTLLAIITGLALYFAVNPNYDNYLLWLVPILTGCIALILLATLYGPGRFSQSQTASDWSFCMISKFLQQRDINKQMLFNKTKKVQTNKNSYAKLSEKSDDDNWNDF